MSTPDAKRTAHDRFRLFIAWYTAILGGFAILLLGMLVLIAYVFGGSVQLYIDRFGEAGVEVAAFAVVCGTVPFGLYVIDSYLRDDARGE
ncbi:hypothetical protein [Halorarum salinum]|uniref:Uncharacterized protein n=1 Tax=Halorarum salinum TaxID=2743089 RepID=A0A7D5L9N2_9EURY|nr:hypothetical protein [Halobaculum salinum]QLG61348.1 hypothetical protein HUG12_06205 [Halobaculum salinum]